MDEWMRFRTDNEVVERETGLEPATSSLGKRKYFVYQEFRRVLCSRRAMELPQFSRFGREWNHKGISDDARWKREHENNQ